MVIISMKFYYIMVTADGIELHSVEYATGNTLNAMIMDLAEVSKWTFIVQKINKMLISFWWQKVIIYFVSFYCVDVFGPRTVAYIRK